MIRIFAYSGDCQCRHRRKTEHKDSTARSSVAHGFWRGGAINPPGRSQKNRLTFDPISPGSVRRIYIYSLHVPFYNAHIYTRCVRGAISYKIIYWVIPNQIASRLFLIDFIFETSSSSNLPIRRCCFGFFFISTTSEPSDAISRILE